MKKTTFAFLLLFLSSCDVKPIAKDGYTFGTPSYEKNVVTITIITYDDKADLLSAAKRKGQNNTAIVAFAELRPPFDNCKIHMMNPKISYEPEFIGHEMAHCFYGQWHRDNNSR